MEEIDRESHTVNSQCLAGRDEIIDLVTTYKLTDCYRDFHPSFPGYTWSGTGIRQSSRLDRIYLSKDFTCRSAECSLFPYSDHNCVHVGFKLSRQTERGKGYWKYNASLNNDIMFCEELRSYYKLWSTLKPSFKSMTEWWENIKGRIKHLAIQHSVRIARQKKKRLLLLQRVCCNSNEDEVDNIIESELRGACIRSRVKILEENEKPSAFFYREERRRAERKVIKSIKNDDGRIVSSNSEITGVFHNFYTNLFTRHADVNLNLQDAFIQCLNHKISDDDKRILDEPISLVELNKAVSRAASNKSPGSDGLPYEFYSSFIDILGNDLVDVFNDTFHSGTLSESQRTCINMMKTCGLKLGRFCSLQLPGNIQWSTKEIKITGIVFGTNDAVLSNWGKKIESSRSRIKSWTNRHLSLLGKTMVINTVIYPLFYFLGPIFPMPYSVLKEIHKIVFSLVWGSRKPDLVSHDVIVLPQLCGGLGLDNLRVKMNALLVKPLFPLFRGNDIPTHLITSRYFIAKQLRVFYPASEEVTTIMDTQGSHEFSDEASQMDGEQKLETQSQEDLFDSQGESEEPPSSCPTSASGSDARDRSELQKPKCTSSLPAQRQGDASDSQGELKQPSSSCPVSVPVNEIMSDVKDREVRAKRKSASLQPKKDRSRSRIRFPLEEPLEYIKMTQIFIEEEPWHSCCAKGCTKTFSSYKTLIEHTAEAHPKMKASSYPCVLKKSCDNTFASPRDWIYHIASDHPEFVKKHEVEFFDRYFLKR
ncbi:hypothetical protein HOLleu_43295 [Holothuria leucospilota]|uniref:C2H2-type domain-containing protein n=1 Tax=Holothuria leucospilota TaxID=206669 RepID=A0A9Q0Y9M2_HOLLE|nr:hypothetical protein HOLleu_43295 [Holothuria leucospilota]